MKKTSFIIAVFAISSLTAAAQTKQILTSTQTNEQAKVEEKRDNKTEDRKTRRMEKEEHKASKVQRKDMDKMVRAEKRETKQEKRDSKTLKKKGTENKETSPDLLKQEK